MKTKTNNELKTLKEYLIEEMGYVRGFANGVMTVCKRIEDSHEALIKDIEEDISNVL